MSKLRERFEAWRDRMDTYNALSACRVPGERDYLIYQAALEPVRELFATMRAAHTRNGRGNYVIEIHPDLWVELAKLLEE